MFGILNSLAKAAVNVVSVPVAVVADVATLGGALTDKEKPYTVNELEKFFDNLTDAGKPD